MLSLAIVFFYIRAKNKKKNKNENFIESSYSQEDLIFD